MHDKKSIGMKMKGMYQLKGSFTATITAYIVFDMECEINGLKKELEDAIKEIVKDHHKTCICIWCEKSRGR